MVTITNYFIRQNKDGKPFVALELTGEIEMVQSSGTGRFYATAKRCTVSSIFPEEIAKSLIGKELPGKIERVESEPYEYLIKETNQIIILSHQYAYLPDEKANNLSNQPAVAICRFLTMLTHRSCLC